MEEDLKGGEEGHVERRLALPIHLLDAGVEEARVEHPAHAPSAKRLRGGSAGGSVAGRSAQRGGARELFFPIRELSSELSGVQLVALPRRVVDVLHRAKGRAWARGRE